MDIGDPNGGESNGFEEEIQPKPRQLPTDLPRSLDDRKNVSTHYTAETEMYDAWQGLCLWRFARLLLTQLAGQSQFLTAPTVAQPLKFSNLSLEDSMYDVDMPAPSHVENDSRLMEMLAAQAAHRDGSASEDEDAIATNGKLSTEEKKEMLQRTLNMAASNGDVERIHRLLNGEAKEFVDINASDEEGTAPLIYASCFVSLLYRLEPHFC